MEAMENSKQWLQELPEDIRERAIRNMGCRKSHSLDAAFDWEDTPEGLDFWIEVHYEKNFDAARRLLTPSDHIPDTGKMGFEQWKETEEYKKLMEDFQFFQVKIDDIMKAAFEAGNKNK